MINGQHIDEKPTETDVVFLIEATSMNGTYFNELKTNYIQPILEYFNRGPLENTENSCDNRNCLYTIILYHASDVRPKPCCRTYAQERDPQFVLTVMEKVRLAGGKAQSNANVVEGLATCLQFFDDIQKFRDGCQKCCVLICNSPPSAIPVMENEQYAGSNLEQLTSLFAERKIFLSVISPRKIPAFFKLFEKTGGDLTLASSKNYSKSGRHLVLLNGLYLKERAISPFDIPPSSPNNPVNVGSPTPVTPYRQATPQPISRQVQQSVSAVDINAHQHMQPQLQTILKQSSQSPQQLQQQQQQSNQIVQQSLQYASQFSQMMSQQQIPQMNPATRPVALVSPSLSQSQMNFPRRPGQQPVKWAPGSQQRSFSPATQSALIAQLQQPPSSILPQLNQRYDGPVINQSNVPQNQQQIQFQHQLQQPQICMVGPSPGNLPVASQQTNYERNPIWQGILEWTEKHKHPSSVTRQIACCVTMSSKDKDTDLKTETWPQKLVMQLLPKSLLISAGQIYLLKAISVWFHPSPCTSLDALKQVMSNGFAGCVQFNSSEVDIKVLIVLYTSDKEMFVGFIPKDQIAFVEDLKKLIQMRKNQATAQNPLPSGGQPQNSSCSQTPGLISDTHGRMPSAVMQTSSTNNPVTGQQNRGLITGDVSHGGVGPCGGMMQRGPSNQTSMMQGGPANQAYILHQNPNPVNVQQGINIRSSPMLAARMPVQADAEYNRQQNLANIQRLQQQLNAAKQQEQLYQTIEPQYARHQLVNIQQEQQQQPPQSRNHLNAVQTPRSNEQYDDQAFFVG